MTSPAGLPAGLVVEPAVIVPFGRTASVVDLQQPIDDLYDYLPVHDGRFSRYRLNNRCNSCRFGKPTAFCKP